MSAPTKYIHTPHYTCPILFKQTNYSTYTHYTLVCIKHILYNIIQSLYYTPYNIQLSVHILIQCLVGKYLYKNTIKLEHCIINTIVHTLWNTPNSTYGHLITNTIRHIYPSRITYVSSTQCTILTPFSGTGT